jgi:hypothetical protein
MFIIFKFIAFFCIYLSKKYQLDWFQHWYNVRTELDLCSIEIANYNAYNTIRECSYGIGVYVFSRPRSQVICRFANFLGIHDPSVKSHLTIIAAFLENAPYYVGFVSFVCCVVLFLLLGALLRIGRHIAARHTNIHMLSPTLPFSIREIQSSFDTFIHGLDLPDPTSTGHRCTAFVRRQLETWALKFSFSYSREVRDVGGSLTRNVRYGKNLHICFPDITSVDHSKRQQNQLTRNKVCHHTIQQCKNWNQMTLLSYSDFHIPLADLADSITSPTIIITHDFQSMSGPFSWFDGEVTGTVTPQLISMVTRDGDSYCHPYHHWMAEGFVLGNRQAMQYRRLGSFGNSVVILAYPGKGSFNRLDPHCMSERVEQKTHYLFDGNIAFRDGDYFRFVDKSAKLIGKISASTIIRTVFSLSFVKRDTTYAGNATGLLRGRMTSDQQPPEMLPYALPLVSQLADNYALTVGHTLMTLPENVVNLNFYQRCKYRMLCFFYSRTPAFLSRFSADVLRTLIGRDKSSSWTPFLWTESMCPNYEIEFKSTDAVVLTDPGHKVHGNDPDPQPFHPKGSGSSAGHDNQQQCRPSKYTSKPARQSRNKSGARTNETPPSTDDKTVARSDGGSASSIMRSSFSNWSKGRLGSSQSVRSKDNSLAGVTKGLFRNSKDEVSRKDTSVPKSPRSHSTLPKIKRKSVVKRSHGPTSSGTVGKTVSPQPAVFTPASTCSSTSDRFGP